MGAKWGGVGYKEGCPLPSQLGGPGEHHEFASKSLFHFNLNRQKKYTATYIGFIKKGTALLSTITLAFLVDFYHFSNSGNRNEYSIIAYNLLT